MSTGKQHHRHFQPRTTPPVSPLALMLLAGCGGGGNALMSGLTINLGALNAEGNSDLADVSGSTGADHIRGDGNPNILKGRAGDDELYGEGGNDQISGGAGDDLIDGGAGFDILGGGEGNDDLQGGDDTEGNWIFGGKGNDVLTGSFGDDLLAGDDGRHTPDFDVLIPGLCLTLRFSKAFSPQFISVLTIMTSSLAGRVMTASQVMLVMMSWMVARVMMSSMAEMELTVCTEVTAMTGFMAVTV